MIAPSPNTVPLAQTRLTHAALAGLGRLVADRYAQAGNRLEEFADCATRSLEEARLHEHVSPEDLIDYLLLADGLPDPKTGENDYGYPAVTVIRQEHFRIELIFWRANVAETHHHGPPGAFQVLMGRRLNTEHRFQSLIQEENGIDLGEMSRIRTTLLEVGDVCHIPAGDGMIHDLVFLEPLCLTISVRATRWQGKISPNSLYLAPSLRFSPRSLVERRRVGMETLTVQRAWGSPKRVRSVLHCSPSHAFALLYSVLEHAPAAFEELAAEVEQIHPEKGRLILGALRETKRRTPLLASFRAVPAKMGAEAAYIQRLVLGLAWIGLDREEAIRVLSRNRPDQPEDLLCAGADAVRTHLRGALDPLSPLLAPVTALTNSIP